MNIFTIIHYLFIYEGKLFLFNKTITVDISIEGDRRNDGFVGAFWEELCENEGTINSATTELCAYYNSHYGSGWNLGDEWKIMGNQYATLP